jgi:hypothetical protein
MAEKKITSEKRIADPYLDRRSVEDRRTTYDLGYFIDGGLERRSARERRNPEERRRGCVKVSKWASVCPKNPSQPLGE